MYPESSNTQTTQAPAPYYLEPEKESKAKVAAKKTGRAIYLVLQVLIGVAVVGVMLYLFVLPINIVDGQSMEPNFCNRDIYFTYKLDSYFQRNPYKRGDVVALKENETTNLIKRVIGMPGDRIRIEGGKVYINDELLDQPFLQSSVYTGPGSFVGTVNSKTYTVPQGKYFVLGDNRPFSLDSREIGPVDPIENAINGKVVLVIWPPQRMRVFDPNQKFAKDACTK